MHNNVNIVTTSKYEALCSLLVEMKSVLVTFSGGADSAFLLKVAFDTLGESVLAVTAHSEIYKESELNEAKSLAQLIGVRHQIISTSELSIDKFQSNPRDRCYHCKSHLFDSIRKLKEENNLQFVLDGTNYDDLTDFRPGMTAAGEFGVRSPLREVCLTKNEIRKLSKELGLLTWDKPSQPCLSSRFPYGTELTDENLRRVEKAEAFLSGLGLKQLRVRVHGDMARIETTPDGIKLLQGLESESEKRLTTAFIDLGYSDVTIDLRGYRMGSMNEK